MLLVFDVGNTETVLGLLADGELRDHWRIATRGDQTADETGLLVRSLLRESGHDVALLHAAVIGSVVPPVTPVLTQACDRYLHVPVLQLDATSPLPIRLEVEEPLTVGADRIANTIAAVTLYRRDTIAVDLGTATTFDCITADGAFVGGVISPGVSTGAETLVRRTAKLPRVDLNPPATVIGKRTEVALRSGIFYGAVEAIDGTVQRILQEWKRSDVLVVATGGLSPLLGPHCRTVQRIEPYLTLFGLQYAYDHVMQASAATPTRPNAG